MSIITVQIDKDLMNEVKEITQKKYPLRKITSYAEATREALIDFVKKNQRFKNKEAEQDATNNKIDEVAKI